MKSKILLCFLVCISLRSFGINTDAIRPDSIKTIDYKKEIKNAKSKPVRYRAVLYSTTSKKFELVLENTGNDGKNLKLFVDTNKASLDDSKRSLKKGETIFDVSNILDGKNHTIYLCLNDLKTKQAKLPFNHNPKDTKPKTDTTKTIKGSVASEPSNTETIDYNKQIKSVASKPVELEAALYSTTIKNFKLTLTGTGVDGTNLKIFAKGSEDQLADSKRTNLNGNTTFDLSDFQDGQNHTLNICLNDVKTIEATFPFNVDPATGSVKTDPSKTATPPARNDFWQYLKDKKLTINLKQYRLTKGECLDSCVSCETGQFALSDQIIYDAASGVTYFQPHAPTTPTGAASTKILMINKNIVVNAGDPLIYRVTNVNPALYDIKLTDTGYSTNVQSNALIDQFLSMSTSAFKPNARNGTEDKVNNDAEYSKVRAGLVLLYAEMFDLLENFRLYSRFYSCVDNKKKQALEAIETYLGETLGKKSYPDISFTGFVDIYLDPTSKADSALNKQLKGLYTQFNTKKYEITSYFPQIPKYDEIDFTLAITKKANSPYPSLLDSKFPTQSVYVKDYFKVDISSGLFYGFIKNHSYSIAADSSTVKSSTGADSTKKGNHIVSENVGSNELGFASFVHFYYKWGNDINISLTLGAGVNFVTTVQPRYFTGISLLLGHDNRFCVSTGIEFGNQTLLSDQYVKDATGVYSVTPGTSSIVYKTQFSHAAFVSLSYDLPFIKSKTTIAPSTTTSN